MTIAGTQTSAALPAQGTAATTNRAAATPASGDHGTAATPLTGNRSQVLAQLQKQGINTDALLGGPAIGAAGIAMPGPYYSPFDRIQSLLSDLMQAIQQLNQPPIDQYPPYDPYGPYGPYPPIEPPYGCPHMHDMPPFPVDPIDPMPPMPPVTRKSPEVGDVLGVMAPSKTAPFGEVKVSSVHGTYKGRDKAVAAAKHLSGIFGNKPFAVAVSGAPGTEKYTVVGLKSDVPLTAKTSTNLVGQSETGWRLDTVAFSAKNAKRVQQGNNFPLTAPAVGPDTPPSPPVPAPAPAPHTH